MRERLQRLIASVTFPANRPDWYRSNGYGAPDDSLEERFQAFVRAQQEETGAFYRLFQNLRLERQLLPFLLANGRDGETEVVRLIADGAEKQPKKPGVGKHVVYFTGVDSLYQDCYLDLSDAVNITGATYYAFEYPGMRELMGEVLEVNDLVNTGLAVVRHLLEEGIDVNDIILQGESFGSAVAYEVQKQVETHSGVKLRVVLNNSFDSFAAAVKDQIGASFFGKPLHFAVPRLLSYAGWQVGIGDRYGDDSPYQIHINHIGDLLLPNSTLSQRVEATRNSAVYHMVDPCPPEFKDIRDSLTFLNRALLTEHGENYLTNKYGRDTRGRLNTHLADLRWFHYPDNASMGAYQALNQFINASNQYIDANRQAQPHSLPDYIVSAHEAETHRPRRRCACIPSFRWIANTFWQCGEKRNDRTAEDSAHLLAEQNDMYR